MSIFDDVYAERVRQDAKWGSHRHLHPHTWLTILVEEVGEAAKDSLEQGPGLRGELIQVAAVAMAWVEDLDGV